MKFNYTDNYFSHKVELTVSSMKELIEAIRLRDGQYEVINEIRMTDKKTNRKAYDELKNQVPCLTANAVFNGYVSNEYFLRSNGYMFFDIDTGDIEKVKEDLLNEHSDKIVAMGKSVGGKGLFFYIKINNPEIITVDNFLSIQNQIIKGEFSDYQIDENAKGISRFHVYTTDENVYYNEEVDINNELGYKIPNEFLNNKSVTKIKAGVNKLIKPNEGKCIDTCLKNVTLFEMKNVLEVLKIKNDKPDCPIDKDYVLKDWEYYSTSFKRIISDNSKHKTFRRQIRNLLALNPFLKDNLNLGLKYIYSYLHFINQNYTDGQPMKEQELKYLVTTYFSYLIKNDIKITGKKKHIVVNPIVPKEQRQAVGCKAYSDYRKLNSKNEIIKAIQVLKEKATIKNVSIFLKGTVSHVTIRKYWKEITGNDEKENTTVKKITSAVETLKLNRQKISMTNISKISGLSRMTVNRNKLQIPELADSPDTEINKPIKHTEMKKETVQPQQIEEGILTAEEEKDGFQSLFYYQYRYGNELGLEMFEGQWNTKPLKQGIKPKFRLKNNLKAV